MDRISWHRLGADPTVRVGSLGLACCALEVESAVALGLLPVETADHPEPRTTVLLVAGTATAALGPAVAAASATATATDPVVVAFGACATSGGPYWDAPSVVPGADRIVAVRQYVPGCPPSPAALVSALQDLSVSP